MEHSTRPVLGLERAVGFMSAGLKPFHVFCGDGGHGCWYCCAEWLGKRGGGEGVTWQSSCAFSLRCCIGVDLGSRWVNEGRD